MSYDDVERFEDPELSRALGRLSGEFPDTGLAQQRVQRRVQQVRRRRVAALSSGALVAVVTVSVLAFGDQPGNRTIGPSNSAELAPPDGTVTVPATSTTVSSAPTTSIAAAVSTSTAVPDTAVESTVSATSVSAPTSAAGEPPSIAPTTTVRRTPRPPASTLPPPPPPSSSQPPAPSTSEPDDDEEDDDDDDDSAVPATQTFSGIGGSLTVSINEFGRLRLVSHVASAGYTAFEIRNDPQRVSVVFRNGELSTRIRVTVDDGVMVPSVNEES
jgi:hypothetical protein